MTETNEAKTVRIQTLSWDTSQDHETRESAQLKGEMKQWRRRRENGSRTKGCRGLCRVLIWGGWGAL